MSKNAKRIKCPACGEWFWSIGNKACSKSCNKVRRALRRGKGEKNDG